MAERLIIDINLNGEGARETTRTREPEDAARVGLLGSTLGAKRLEDSYYNFNKAESSDILKRFHRVGKGLGLKDAEFMRETRQGFFFQKEQIRGFGPEDYSDLTDEQKFDLGAKLSTRYRLSLSKESRMGAKAVALKTLSSVASYAQHTSGDSYINENMNIAVKTATMGIAFSINPVLGSVAAISEGINVATDYFKYRHDRRVEGGQIANITAISGNLSYGREGR